MSGSHIEDEVARELAGLAETDFEALRRRWRNMTARPAPEHISKQLLIRLIAYRIQADAFGDLDRQSIKLLRQIAEQRAKEKAGTGVPTLESLNVSSRGAKSLAPGTVIGREYGGTMHHVMVLADGFAWNGATFRSLSEVAFAITGTRWNGPRFFGLRTSGKEGVGSQKDGSQ